MQSAAVSVQPVIMAGGAGTRLWPSSRSLYPKQFLSLDDSGRTLLQQTLDRVLRLEDARRSMAPPCVVSNEAHRFIVVDQMRELSLPEAPILLEPAGKNTAPALTLAALCAVQQADADPILLVTPADQTVTDLDAWTSALHAAIDLAQEGSLVLLGIKPDRPETGFGYVRAGAAAGTLGVEVLSFREKPDAATAASYLADGMHYWNGGLFIVRASVWLAAIERYRPDILAAVRLAWSARTVDSRFVRPGQAEFAAVPAESIDYAVMEPCAADAGRAFPVKMVPLDAGWSDLGSWEAVWQTAPKDASGNAIQGDVVLSDTRDSIVHAQDRLVAVAGLDNVVVVETSDAVLVTQRHASQSVKNLVQQLGQQGRSEGDLHRLVHRPWGWYDSIESGARFQVKRIIVKPGASLSLQMHHHRAEHWIVVAGTAKVTRGEETFLLAENQSTYIPLGERHQLSNPGHIPLEIIEIQSGAYLGEDDIVRFDDRYGRR